MASKKQISDFLQNVEQRAFKRAMYQLKNEDDALDVVQESMTKLVKAYQDKPIQEFPALFNSILHNTMMDYFRENTQENKLFVNVDDINHGSDEDFNMTDILMFNAQEVEKSPEDLALQFQSLKEIEEALSQIPPRQSEAFLLRYLEELSVQETAQIMGCSEGSVKTHCFRAIATLSNILKDKKHKP